MTQHAPDLRAVPFFMRRQQRQNLRDGVAPEDRVARRHAASVVRQLAGEQSFRLDKR
jgi:hypothetical protein